MHLHYKTPYIQIYENVLNRTMAYMTYSPGGILDS